MKVGNGSKPKPFLQQCWQLANRTSKFLEPLLVVNSRAAVGDDQKPKDRSWIGGPMTAVKIEQILLASR